jgi:hypothetical protein
VGVAEGQRNLGERSKTSPARSRSSSRSSSESDHSNVSNVSNVSRSVLDPNKASEDLIDGTNTIEAADPEQS